jgi:hypothetical protein
MCSRFFGLGFDFAVEGGGAQKLIVLASVSFDPCLVSEKLVFDVWFFGFCAKTYIEGFLLLF